MMLVSCIHLGTVYRILNKKPKKHLRVQAQHCNFALQEWLQVKPRVRMLYGYMHLHGGSGKTKLILVGECNEVIYSSCFSISNRNQR